MTSEKSSKSQEDQTEPSDPDRDQTRPDHADAVDRGDVISVGMRSMAAWSGRLILITIVTAIALWLLAQMWVVVFPLLLALILTTVLYPVAGWLKRHGWPDALAALVTLVTFLVLVVGILSAIAPSIVRQASQVAVQAQRGLEQLQNWLTGPPFNLSDQRLDTVINEGVTAVTDWLQGNSGSIASGVLSGFSAVTSFTVALVLTLVLTFFFLKDGHRFLPFVRQVSGRAAGRHLTEVLSRVWRTLGGFIRAQAVVSAVDAVLIGLGLVVLGVPLAGALAVLTFFGGFIPIIGAFTAGALAVLVALVSNGLGTALAVLAIVLLVQQLEGNVLQPVLQSRVMDLHPGVILLAVALGGTLFGIAGAFLGVPVAASVVAVLRYMSEQVNLRAGEVHASELDTLTDEGRLTAVEAERSAPAFRELALERIRAHRQAVRKGRDHRAQPLDPAATQPVRGEGPSGGRSEGGGARRRLTGKRGATRSDESDRGGEG